MTNNQPIVETVVSFDDIQPILTQIEPIISNLPPSHVIIALLAFVMMVQKPEVTGEQLQEGVRGASQWISMYLTSTEPISEANRVRMN